MYNPLTLEDAFQTCQRKSRQFFLDGHKEALKIINIKTIFTHIELLREDWKQAKLTNISEKKQTQVFKIVFWCYFKILSSFPAWSPKSTNVSVNPQHF